SKVARKRGPYPGPTRTATLADEFKNYMVDSGKGTIKEVRWSDASAGGAQLGDVLGYDWDGPTAATRADGRMDHLAIVTGFSTDGRPLVSQHTKPQSNRYWAWSESDNKWITQAKPGARVYLIRISNWV
ncbi:amidase domain-containing protein, partial [Bradyrhizobium sp. NBAIM08]|uniref:amidase domain-containing protein n=1 Tax=Bradyrhizobium sp. NBAIM08 TaxID=2793815 RepID=UPI001CD80C58